MVLLVLRFGNGERAAEEGTHFSVLLSKTVRSD